MKRLLLATVLVILALLAIRVYGNMMEEKGRCECMDNYLGINTEWTGWKCVFISDPLDFFHPEESL